MTSARPHIVVFESDPRGHALEWMGHLIDHAARRPADRRLTLVVAKDLVETLRRRAGRGVEVVALSDDERRRCNHPSLLVASFAKWWTMRRHLRRADAGHGLFLSIDHLALPLALRLPLAGCSVSGVLFRPTAHYREFGCPPVGWRERLRDLHKHVLTGMMLKHRRVATVFSLDPYFPDHARRRYRRGDKVKGLGDPAFPAPVPSDGDRALLADAPPDRATFVLFGEITERKGVMPLLSALALLPAEVAGRTNIVIAGRIDPSLRRTVAAAAGEVRLARPALWLKLVDRRLTGGEITALIEHAAAVLAPYQRFVGASGVLLWAASMQRPVIAQAYGLVGELVRRFRLGAAVDSSDPAAIATAITAAVRNGADGLGDPASMTAFVRSRTPEAFAEKLLSCPIASRSAAIPKAAARDDTEWSQRFPV